jgi:quercetin dioxygenase-like cupin family protein
MSSARRLPFTFDADALKSDLGEIAADEWVPHFNPQYYEGEWSGVALRSTGGRSAQLYADPSKSKFYADTPALERCLYIKEALGAFECALETVRLLKLAPGSRIREHTDFDLGERFGVVRVHVPVLSNPSVEFTLGGESVSMREGENWYLDLSLPHSVANRGTTDRVHLVVDCVVNDWIRSVIRGV